jgi:hypothetical protein
MSTRTLAWVSIAWLLASPVGASARDVCLQDDAGVWVFKKVKAPKKPGAIAPLNGVYIESGEVAPFSGTAYVLQDARLVVGVLAHGFAPLGKKVLTTNRSATFVVDPKTFEGGGYTDTNGNGDVDTSDAWTAIDCADVIFP